MKKAQSIGVNKMNLGKWQILFWPVSPTSWLWSKGVWPNNRYPIFDFWNFGPIEVRHFGVFNQKKVCKKCGKEE